MKCPDCSLPLGQICNVDGSLNHYRCENLHTVRPEFFTQPDPLPEYIAKPYKLLGLEELGYIPPIEATGPMGTVGVMLGHGT